MKPLVAIIAAILVVALVWRVESNDSEEHTRERLEEHLPGTLAVEVELEAAPRTTELAHGPEPGTERRAIEPAASMAPEASTLDATLTGNVTRTDGTPIAGAVVRWAREVVETDDAGGYSLRVDSARCEQATASATGHGARRQRVAELLAGSEHTLDFVLQAGLTIRGRVRDDNSAPVAGATLRLESDDGHEAITATSDSDGVYALLDVARSPGAQVQFYARAAGYAIYWPRLTLPAEGDLLHDVRLVPGARVRGRVLDERGEPLSGAIVWAGAVRHYIDCRQTISDEGGYFELIGIRSMGKLLGVVHHGFAEHVQDLETPRNVRELPYVTVRLGRGRTVTGSVVDELGRPVPGVKVHVGPRGAEGKNARSAEDGTFALEQLPDSKLLVNTSADGWRDAWASIPAGASDPLVLRLERAGPLRGRVVDAVSGEPLRAFIVRLVVPELRAGEHAALGFRTDWGQCGVSFDAADGRWSTGGESLTPGVLGVEVRATGYAPLVVARALVAIDADTQELVHRLQPVRR